MLPKKVIKFLCKIHESLMFTITRVICTYSLGDSELQITHGTIKRMISNPCLEIVQICMTDCFIRFSLLLVNRPVEFKSDVGLFYTA